MTQASNTAASGEKTPRIETRAQAKAYARMIRAEKAAAKTPISHSAALELVASQLGYRDWNTLSARLSNQPEVVFQVGDRVEGRYLKQPMAGRVIAVREKAGGSAFEVTIELDEPVDVVTFDSFSAFRSRVTGTVSIEGVSASRTSDGVPHLVVSRTSAMLV